MYSRSTYSSAKSYQENEKCLLVVVMLPTCFMVFSDATVFCTADPAAVLDFGCIVGLATGFLNLPAFCLDCYMTINVCL